MRTLFASIVAFAVLAFCNVAHAASCKFVNNTSILFQVDISLVNSTVMTVSIAPYSTQIVNTGTVDYSGVWCLGYYAPNPTVLPQKIVTVDLLPIEAQMLTSEFDGIGVVTFNSTH
jgi:hypothetical protein